MIRFFVILISILIVVSVSFCMARRIEGFVHISLAYEKYL